MNYHNRFGAGLSLLDRPCWSEHYGGQVRGRFELLVAGVSLEAMNTWHPDSVLDARGVCSEAHLWSQSQCETVKNLGLKTP